MSKQKVLIVCGGPDNEHEVSLLTGKNVYDNIDRHLFDPQLCLIDKQERWYTLEESNLADIAQWSRADFVPLTYDNSSSCFATGGYDLVFNALHGKYGEGGRFQCILDQAGVKYTGSGVSASVVAINKRLTSQIVSTLNSWGVRIPLELEVRQGQNYPDRVKDFLKELPATQKIVLKANTDGSSFNVHIFESRDFGQLQLTLRSMLETNEAVLLQECIEGMELTCPVLGTGRDLETLPVGLIKPARGWFDFEAKYSGQSEELFPAPVDTELSTRMQFISRDIHEALGCRGLTRSDFIVDRFGEVHFLEINTSPGMTAQSLCPKSAYAYGWSYSELVTRIIKSA